MTRQRPMHAAYVRHVTTAARCACATGGQCETARDLLAAADAESWQLVRPLTTARA